MLSEQILTLFFSKRSSKDKTLMAIGATKIKNTAPGRYFFMNTATGFVKTIDVPYHVVELDKK